MNDIVKLSYPEPEIALISMENRAGRNTITKPFILEITEIFEAIDANPRVKVVITQGYENYYLSGGDKETLLELTQGDRTFADLLIFKLPLMCKLPTIAAVQGHAMGGGLAFACMHDFIFLANGPLYGATFMNYGFTPGMCATYTIPKKFGENCGRQMLFTARQYDMGELKDINCILPFYPKNEVIEQALLLAKYISAGTLTSIKLLKEQLSSRLREMLPGIIEAEVAMHAKTITTEEAIRRINDNFGE